MRKKRKQQNKPNQTEPKPLRHEQVHRGEVRKRRKKAGAREGEKEKEKKWKRKEK